MYRKTHISRLLTFVVFIIALMLMASCRKYLAAVPDDRFRTIDNLEDMQNLLDGIAQNSDFPCAMEIGSDNYYIDSDTWNTLGDGSERDLYIWKAGTIANGDWDFSYRRIFDNNVILESLLKIGLTEENRDDYSRIKGSALFLRAYNFYLLAQQFAPQYASQTLNEEAIPLRLSTDVVLAVPPASVRQTYERIIKDCLEAKNLLPKLSIFNTRPGRAAVWALLARVYIEVGDDLLAKQAADSSLAYNNLLYDYNDINPQLSLPFQTSYNTEIIFMSRMATTTILSSLVAKVDTTLYRSYVDADLRKSLFFKQNPDGSHTFRGDYNESNNGRLFCGLAVDEVYLVRAEASARLGDLSGGLDHLNTLMRKRFKTGFFTDYIVSSQGELLELILNERRKELIFRGVRWTDLRRLNMDERFKDTLVRNIDDIVYKLLPGSEGYILKKPSR